MKLLKHHMHRHPWWLHFLSNPIGCLQLQHQDEETSTVSNRSTIKIVNSEGEVKIYERPIHVAELMTQFPKHLVCRSDSFYIGQKIPPLSQNEKLQLGENYFLLPNQFFQTVFTFVTIASLASRNAFFKKAATCRQPFDIQKNASSGSARIRVSDEFISQLMEQAAGGSSSDKLTRVCSTAQLHKDYTQLVGLRRWKPKLETIKEKEKSKRRFSSFGMKRSKKSKNNKISQHHHPHPHPHPHPHQKKKINQKSTATDHFVNGTSTTKSSSKSSKIIKIKSSRK